ncbi:hypothetical protein TNCT_664951 [Trichonephila clavata]|uniref:Uncharacterized protein n=1 Tax=Trichonephila clavata TaxID=2740835 RepID=A0A8X6HUQ5_TRICU|nr:hypothetical protein TNCT_664951 [Trichonephila clavata]
MEEGGVNNIGENDSMEEGGVNNSGENDSMEEGGVNNSGENDSTGERGVNNSGENDSMEERGVNNSGENYSMVEGGVNNSGESLFQMVTESAFKSYINNNQVGFEIFTQILSSHYSFHENIKLKDYYSCSRRINTVQLKFSLDSPNFIKKCVNKVFCLQKFV